MKFEECVVVSVFPERGTVRVKREQSDGMISAELPLLFRGTLKNQVYSLPSIDEQVVCIFKNSSDGYVLGAIYSEASQPKITGSHKHYFAFDDGASFEYDTKLHELTIKCNKVTVIGDINCEGTITSRI